MTGFRVKAPILKAFAEMRKISANDFSPELNRFLQKCLAEAYRNTPVREAALINRNQRKQYKRRLNYIPSMYDKSNSVLIFNDENEQWLRVDGQWYRPDIWHLPDNVYQIYQDLLAERMRRDLNPSTQTEFIRERSQARFLYKKSWKEIADSAGVPLRVSQSVANAHSRHNPPKRPPRGYVRKVGGKNTLSIIVYNPLLEQNSRYKVFSGKTLINSAMRLHRPQFELQLLARQTRMFARIIEALLA